MKTVLLTVVILMVLGGGLFGAANFGLVEIPGLSPIKFEKPLASSKVGTGGVIDTLSASLQALTKKAAADALSLKNQPVAPELVKRVEMNQDAGDKKLADIWNGMDVTNLRKLTEKWNEKTLARVLLKMDTDQVSAYLNDLAAAKPEKATKISTEIERLASLLSPAPASAA